jgi:hypothetical protein
MHKGAEESSRKLQRTFSNPTEIDWFFRYKGQNDFCPFHSVERDEKMIVRHAAEREPLKNPSIDQQ